MADVTLDILNFFKLLWGFVNTPPNIINFLSGAEKKCLMLTVNLSMNLTFNLIQSVLFDLGFLLVLNNFQFYFKNSKKMTMHHQQKVEAVPKAREVNPAITSQHHL